MDKAVRNVVDLSRRKQRQQRIERIVGFVASVVVSFVEWLVSGAFPWERSCFSGQASPCSWPSAPMNVQLATEPPINFSRDVAVVGSSKDLLNSSYGTEIDSHEEVIRFNRAGTERFERQVGSRTTLRVVNFHTFQSFWPESVRNTAPGFDVHFCRKLRRSLIAVHSREPIEDPHRYVESSNRVVCLFATPVVARINSILFAHEVEVTFITEPRTGFVTIVMLVASGIVPCLFGFGVDEGKVSDRKYWWREADDYLESMDLEALALRRLEDQGKVHIYR